MDIAHSGWLLKRGGLPFRRWEKRFFALVRISEQESPALFFKASASDAAGWLGVLPLSDGASCGALARGEAHPEASCFYVHRLGRTYVLAAGADAEASRWLTALADELRRHAQATDTPQRGRPSLRLSQESEAGAPVPAGAEELAALNAAWREALRAQEAALRDANAGADSQRARAERALMRAEEERSALVSRLTQQEETARRWRGVARRTLARVAVAWHARDECQALQPEALVLSAAIDETEPQPMEPARSLQPAALLHPAGEEWSTASTLRAGELLLTDAGLTAWWGGATRPTTQHSATHCAQTER